MAAAMGTCLSADGAMQRDGGAGAAGAGCLGPAAAGSCASSLTGKRRAAGDLLFTGNAEDEEMDGLEAQAARKALLSGLQRWCLDVSEWGELSTDQWDGLLGLLSEAESARVRAFLRENDRKLALGSRLLQRAVVSKVFGVKFLKVDIRRTSESKPFFPGVMTAVEDGSVSPLLKNWNFNVSHHGKYVAIASEPACLCGVDIVDTNRRANEQGPADDYLRYFTDHFTAEEWETVKSPPDDVEKMRRFYLHWGLKEAYVKAVGQGLGYDLRRVSFVPGDWVDCCSLQQQQQQQQQRQRRSCSCPRSLPAAAGTQFSDGCTKVGAESGTADSGGGSPGGMDPSCGGGGKAEAEEGKSWREAQVKVLCTEQSECDESGGRDDNGGDDADAAEDRRGGSWTQEDRLGCACGVGAVVVQVDHVPRPDWSFKVLPLPDGYAACVARGPPSACSLSGQEAGVISDADAPERGQSLPQLRFRKVRLQEIIPSEAAARLFGHGLS